MPGAALGDNTAPGLQRWMVRCGDHGINAIKAVYKFQSVYTPTAAAAIIAAIIIATSVGVIVNCFISKTLLDRRQSCLKRQREALWCVLRLQ